MSIRKTDVDLINEAYSKDVQQLDEMVPAIIAGAKAMAPTLVKTAATSAAMTAGKNIGDKVTGVEDDFDITDDDNITDLEPGENISKIKKDAVIQTIIDSLEELIKGNTGPDSPCGEHEALELVQSHCGSRLHERSLGSTSGY
tara:strand:- start:1136 stop:1564 length:429 start_codon:yes stop_codon:yes gene_type:complete